MNERDLLIEALTKRAEILKRAIAERDAYADKLEQRLLAKCKDKVAMKKKIEENKAKLGLK